MNIKRRDFIGTALSGLLGTSIVTASNDSSANSVYIQQICRMIEQDAYNILHPGKVLASDKIHKDCKFVLKHCPDSYLKVGNLFIPIFPIGSKIKIAIKDILNDRIDIVNRGLSILPESMKQKIENMYEETLVAHAKTQRSYIAQSFESIMIYTDYQCKTKTDNDYLYIDACANFGLGMFCDNVGTAMFDNINFQFPYKTTVIRTPLIKRYDTNIVPN